MRAVFEAPTVARLAPRIGGDRAPGHGEVDPARAVPGADIDRRAAFGAGPDAERRACYRPP